jgi:hypothetical protein
MPAAAKPAKPAKAKPANAAAPKAPAKPKPLKTQPTDASVPAFLAAVENETRRADAGVVDALMREATGEAPVMWGPTIIGYGQYPSASGPWPIVGFSPRKAELVLYIMPGFSAYDGLLASLGKHKTGKSCLYVRKLADIELPVLRELIFCAVKAMRAKYA